MSADYTKMDSRDLLNACGSDASKWADAFTQHAKVTADDGGDPMDRGWLIGWFANAMMRALDEQRWSAGETLNPAEALFGFAGWLTSRKEPITMGANHHAGDAVNAVGEFIKANDLGDVSSRWPNNLKHPTETP